MSDIQREKEVAHQKIRDLVEKFRNDTDAKKHNEAQIYKDYVLPLFSALGWDVNSREVTIEETIAGKRADFGFYIKTPSRGYLPVFYLEIKNNQQPLTEENNQQATNYAYLKGITWAVLTNFAQLSVHNADFPKEFFHFSYENYADVAFDDLWLLSKSAFEAGLLDKKAEVYGVKAKRKPVTEKLFDQLVQWRKELFEEFGNSTPYTHAQIDNAIQLLFDRLIFIRSMEDRKVEAQPPQLLQIANQATPRLGYKVKDEKSEKRFNQDLQRLFKDFRENYNSNLFKLSLVDEIEFKTTIAHIIKGLYGSNTDFVKYDFEVISADILGAVYEQYLSFKAQDPSGKHTLKSIKRKSQGIYYTPLFIVKYIVQQTLGEALKHHPNPLKIRVLDPACGSGSFLIEAFDFLYDYFKTAIPNEQERRQHILTENLYGVDLDEQATEVTRLNLLLRASYERHRLPELPHIKVGNSLVTDNKDIPDNFDWQFAFKDIFDEGGFDVIIGNPPYVRQETLGDDFKNHVRDTYPDVYAGTADLYVYFIQRGLSLLKSDGYLGYILPNKWLCANYGKPLRRFLGGFTINQIIDFGTSPVFPNADVNACLLFLQNAPATEAFYAIDPQAFIRSSDNELKRKNEYTHQEKPATQISNPEFISANQYLIERSYLRLDGWTLAKDDAQLLFSRLLLVGTPLREIAKIKIHWGIKTGYDKAFVIDKQTRDLLIRQDPNSAEIIKPYLTVDKRKELRYAPPVTQKFIIFARRGIDITSYPAILAHLERYKDKLMPKPDTYDNSQEWGGRKSGTYQWYEIQDTTAYYPEFETPKIVYPEVGKRGQFTLDLGNHYLNATLFMISGLSLDDYHYLLGIFNSTLFTHISAHVVCRALSGSLRWKTQYMEKMPIPNATNDQRTKLIELVKTQLILHADYAKLHSTDSNRRVELDEYITRTDKAIDLFVTHLYGLAEKDMVLLG